MTQQLEDRHASARRARMLFSMLAVPKLRAQLAQRLAAESAAESAAGGALDQLDWLDTSGNVDVPLLRATAEDLLAMIGPTAVLDTPRITELPAQEDDRIALSCRVVEIVFDRVGRSRALTEPELNAGIMMLCRDHALVRRDAVDSGFLQRSPDGARYSLTGSGQ